MAKRRRSKTKRNWLVWITTGASALSALAFFLFFLFFLVIFAASQAEPFGNVAVIPIEGLIVVDGQPGFGQQLTSSTKTLKLLDKADENDHIEAILLEINSPGGSAVASAEIADRIKEIDKPVYSAIRSTGASGAYWIASATDKLFVHEFSVTGSIGVIGSYLEFAGFLEDYNVTYRRLVSGKYKDAGSPYKELSSEEEELFQGLLSKIHKGFIDEVAMNRDLPREKVRELATGFVYLGEEAVELGLADTIGSKSDAIEELETKLNISAELAEYKTRRTIFDELGLSFQQAAYNVGAGVGAQLRPSRLEIRT